MLDEAYKRRKYFLILIPIIVFIMSIILGRYPMSLRDIWNVLENKLFGLNKPVDEALETVIFQVRLPRVTAAFLVGGALAASGAAYQGMFRNPLISPDILGASAGASFGACIGILFSWSIAAIQLSAFVFGLVSVFITYIISKSIRGRDAALMLVLTGILVGTIFSSLVSLTKFVADPYGKLPEITFWLMGSLAAVKDTDVYMLLPCFIIGIVPLYLLRWKLNVLSFGEEAQTMGLNINRLRMIVIICATLMTSSCIAVSGLIGWIGLVIPHLARTVAGPDYKKLLPYAVVTGGTFLLIIDDIARCASSLEVPLGILTSILGAPFFIYLLMYSRRGWN